MNGNNLRFPSFFFIALCGLASLSFAPRASAEVETEQTDMDSGRDQVVLDDGEQLCIDTTVEPDDQVNAGPGALWCEMQCHREYDCAGQGQWCWDALNACIDACHS